MHNFTNVNRWELAQLITDFAIVRLVPGMVTHSYNVDLEMYGLSFTLLLTYCNNVEPSDFQRVMVDVKTEVDKEFSRIVAMNLDDKCSAGFFIGQPDTKLSKVVQTVILEVTTETLFKLRHNVG